MQFRFEKLTVCLSFFEFQCLNLKECLFLLPFLLGLLTLGGSLVGLEQNLQAETSSKPVLRRDMSQLTEGSPDRIPEKYRSFPRIKVDPAAARAVGLNLYEGKHVLLVTDLELTDSVKNLTRAVDEAYPQLCGFFGVEEDPEWKLTVFLMESNLPFVEADFLPEILPPFDHGFSFNYDCWVYEQPSEYYRQHLVIHEMVHSFSSTVLGSAGPDWFAEGMAELLGMHDFSASPIQLGFMPPNRESVPYCGRIREIHDAIQRGEVRTLERAARHTKEDFQTNAVYYWGWALGRFLEHNPETREALHGLFPLLKTRISEEEFTEAFWKSLEGKRSAVEKHWLMFAASIDYGFDLEPMLFDADRGVSLKENGGKKVLPKIQVNHGWQNSGIHVQKGDRIRIRAKGRFEICRSGEEFWPCEPNGVTIEYLNGMPLGILQAVILTDEETLSEETMNDRQEGTFFKPIAVGLSKTFTVPFDGTILLRANLPTCGMEENRGEFAVEISERSL